MSPSFVLENWSIFGRVYSMSSFDCHQQQAEVWVIYCASQAHSHQLLTGLWYLGVSTPPSPPRIEIESIRNNDGHTVSKLNWYFVQSSSSGFNFVLNISDKCSSVSAFQAERSDNVRIGSFYSQNWQPKTLQWSSKGLLGDAALSKTNALT